MTQKLMPVLIVISVLGVSAGIFFGYQYLSIKHQNSSSTNSPSPDAQSEIKQVTDQVSKLIRLPQNETPTVYTISDVNKLNSQPFFAQAQNGDKVLIYSSAKEAIIYSPTLNKIISVAPINIGSGSAAPAQIRVMLRNGTTVNGLTTKFDGIIKQNLPNSTIVGRENAAKSSYDKTVLVIINPNDQDVANNLAKSLNINISNLPPGESKPDADLLIILGKDKTG